MYTLRMFTAVAGTPRLPILGATPLPAIAPCQQRTINKPWPIPHTACSWLSLDVIKIYGADRGVRSEIPPLRFSKLRQALSMCATYRNQNWPLQRLPKSSVQNHCRSPGIDTMSLCFQHPSRCWPRQVADIGEEGYNLRCRRPFGVTVICSTLFHCLYILVLDFVEARTTPNKFRNDFLSYRQYVCSSSAHILFCSLLLLIYSYLSIAAFWCVGMIISFDWCQWDSCYRSPTYSTPVLSRMAQHRPHRRPASW